MTVMSDRVEVSNASGFDIFSTFDMINIEYR